MDVVVTGRNVEVSDRFRAHIGEKMSNLERYDSTTVRYEIELYHEENPRLAKMAQRVQITGKGGGSTVRAEASGPDFHAALGHAVDKLEERLRRQHDRRKVHYGLRQPTSVAEATAGSTPVPNTGSSTAPVTGFGDGTATRSEARAGEYDLPRDEIPVDGPGRIVREKQHPAEPMSVNDALGNLELLGHDFYLFVDSANDRPSVIYRRQAFDYGIIRLVER